MYRETPRRHMPCSCLGVLLALIVLPIALGMFIMLAIFVERILVGNRSYDTSWEAPVPEWTPYYDSQCFVQQNGRIVYEDGETTMRATGVDVSSHQGRIDWAAVSEDGISFAMIRAGYRGNTEGNLHYDKFFEENLTQATDASIACGVYFYSQAINEDEAREEAHFVLDLLGERQLDYPIVFDYELGDGNRIAHLDMETATACAHAFCDTILAAGYDCMLYGNRYDLGRLDLSGFDNCPIWFAEYAAAPTREDPFAIWQYTAHGSVAGIDGTIDLNLNLSLNPKVELEAAEEAF